MKILLRGHSETWTRFFLRIILPTLLAIILSVGAVYMVIIPSFTSSFIDGKKEMIRQLTNSAWSIMDLYHREEIAGRLSSEEAKARALSALESLRYGEQNRDYFWITDNTPTLLMHPYSKELVGVDLSEFEDVAGKKIFQEIKNTVSQQESGFIDYSWIKKYTEELNAPKLSYVKRFTPWQWIVGTGVFLDDVERKTARITQRLSRLSLIAVSMITLLLLYVGRQSYVIERQRKRAEIDLTISRKKYKRLVETATDPILMFFNGRCIYSNKPVWSLLQYSQFELERIAAHDLFASDIPPQEKEEATLSPQNYYYREGKHEVTLRSKDGNHIPAHLFVSKMDLDGKEAVVMNIRDISGAKRAERELGESQEKYKLLTGRLDIGVFRLKAEKRLKLIEANPATLKLFDIEDDISEIYLEDILKRNKVFSNIYDIVLREGYVKKKALNLKNERRSISISLSLVVARDSEGHPLYCDGIIEDVSEQSKKEQERENLIVELQTSLLFLNQPLYHVPGEFVACDFDVSIAEAAEFMVTSDSNSLLVRDQAGEINGIVTDMALREKVVADRLSYDTPVWEVMSSPLIFIDDSALIFEASMLMEERGVKHLVVKDSKGEITSVISNEDLLNVHRYSSTFLINEIGDARSVEEVIGCQKRLPRIIKALVDSGAHARNITRIITTVSDAILVRLIDFAIEEMGEPPTRFAFISLGSEGREEQTLATDQDNAIIFEDVAEQESESVFAYYLAFSEKVCTWLDQAGYDFCKGNVMAMNPKWCQPVSKWKENFSYWITEARPKDLMEVSIFFDFRCMYGDKSFTEELREHITTRVANRDAFFYQLAQNALLFRLPVDFFGNISVESGGEHPNTFNIKHAIALVVGYARIYAINFGLDDTNTLHRLDLLWDRDFVGRIEHEEICEAYNYLMQIRFKHQITMMDQGLAPDNHISLEELNYMEKSVLKKIFSQVGTLQKRLNAIGKVEIFF